MPAGLSEISLSLPDYLQSSACIFLVIRNGTFYPPVPPDLP
jgi:hypothetical protein